MDESSNARKTARIALEIDSDYARPFYGREKESSQIERWIFQSRCRIISILGMGGIGKTGLTLEIIRNNKENFDFIIRRSLLNTPPVEATLQGLLDFLSSDSDKLQNLSSEEMFANISYFLKKYRCLIVLDNVESVNNHKDYKGYQKFFNLVLQDSHKSCLLLTSREEVIENKKDEYIESLLLEGLSIDDGLRFFEEFELDLSSSSEDDLGKIVEFYGGNPLALQLVARNIASLWDGSLSDFIDFTKNDVNSRNDSFTVNIRVLLDKTFQRLPPSEERILYLLTISFRSLKIEEIEQELSDEEEKLHIEKTLNSLCRRSLINKSSYAFQLHPFIREYSSRRLINRIFKDKDIEENIPKLTENNSIVRSIEFPPEYREAGTSILMYFNHVLKLKYPDIKVQVRIEQDGLILRMIILTPAGHKESIERTIQEYGMVVSGQLQPDIFLSDPFEIMALRNKLEIANLELRQTRELLNLTQNNSQKRVESLEVEVNRLHRLIERSLQSKDTTLGIIENMNRQEGKNYDLRGAKFGGGFATEGGFQKGGSLIDTSSTNNLSEAALQIQELLQQLETQGSTSEEAQQKVASDLAKQAESDSSVMGKLVQWGKSLADTAGKTTVSEAAKGVIKLALQISGIPMP